MFGLFEKRGEAELPAAPAVPVTLDLTLSFEEPGYAVLASADVRFRIKRADIETLTSRGVTIRKFEDAASPASGIFDAAAIAKSAAVARLLHHGADLYQAARILGEKQPELRNFYAWAISQNGWREAPATAERTRLEAGDRLQSLAPIPGGVMLREGRKCSIQTGAPVVEKYVRVNGADVARLLRVGSVSDAAKALQVDADGLEEWIKVNSKMIEVLK